MITIVCLGASNTEGYGVSRDEAYPARLEALLKARGIEARVLNAGISGEPTSGMLARIDRDVPAGTSLVILQPGINDAFHGMAHLREGIHYTPAGYQLLAERILPAVLEVVE